MYIWWNSLVLTHKTIAVIELPFCYIQALHNGNWPAEPCNIQCFQKLIVPLQTTIVPLLEGHNSSLGEGGTTKIFSGLCTGILCPPFSNSFRHLWYSVAQSINRLWLIVQHQHTQNGLPGEGRSWTWLCDAVFSNYFEDLLILTSGRSGAQAWAPNPIILRYHLGNF